MCLSGGMATAAPEVQSRLAAAAAARQRGQAADELRLLDEAVALAPSDPRVLNARGARALTDGDAATATEYFGRAANADPGEPILWMNLASATRLAGDADRERAALERALEIDRFYFGALLRKAELEERVGNKREAVLAWSAVISVVNATTPRAPIMDDAVRRGQEFLAAQTSDLANRLDSEFGADRSQDPDMRRFNATMDLLLGRRSVFSNECQGLHFPFLPADEFFDKRHFPWLAGTIHDGDTVRVDEGDGALLLSTGKEAKAA